MKLPGEKLFHVREEESQQTLAALLRRWLGGVPWSEVERLIQKRHVLVNGNLTLDKGRRLKPQEVVKVLPHSAAPLPEATDVKLVFVDPHVVVVEKPSGMTSLRHTEERNWPDRRKQLQPTLDELLPRIVAKKSKSDSLQKGKKTSSPAVPLRAVHRLDRDTSGLMVFARTVAAERDLGKQFREHTIHRVYHAIVPGRLNAQTITSVLVRDRGDGRRGSGRPDDAGKQAITHVRPLQSLGRYTLIECQLETGRTHQIRIHLAELGHPLCGEKVYHQQLRQAAMVDRSGAPRIALHAAELGFVHPATGASLHFEMPMPADLRALMERLKEGR